MDDFLVAEVLPSRQRWTLELGSIRKAVAPLGEPALGHLALGDNDDRLHVMEVV